MRIFHFLEALEVLLSILNNVHAWENVFILNSIHSVADLK